MAQLLRVWTNNPAQTRILSPHLPRSLCGGDFFSERSACLGGSVSVVGIHPILSYFPCSYRPHTISSNRSDYGKEPDVRQSHNRGGSMSVSLKIHRLRRGLRRNHLALKTASNSHMTTVASRYRSRGSSHCIPNHSLLGLYAPAFDRQVQNVRHKLSKPH